MDFKKLTLKPVYKKDDPFEKASYRPISIIPILPKAFNIYMKFMNL